MNTNSKEFKEHGNAVLANFMGENNINLRYDLSPDLIWKVVEKIESLVATNEHGVVQTFFDIGEEPQYYSVQIEGCYCAIYNLNTMETVCATEANTKMEAVFETCILFAEWYEENK